ncbi:MAG: hypothetical protein LQ346_008306 [Caloplaca aetnensis]|nr:MAG: hypothetical protein LQ346_008306 [Caloplaca aetnensis]
MASTAADQQTKARRVLPKRKRKETSYFPSDSETSDIEAADVQQDATDTAIAPLNKKAKITIPPASTKPVAKKKIFPFTTLPAELKNKIYADALTSNHEVPLIYKLQRYHHVAELGDTDSFQKFMRNRHYRYYPPFDQLEVFKPSFGPNFLLLNRQIHAETQPILYGANTFAFEDTKALHAFCATIGPKNCASLRRLVVRSLGYSDASRAMIHPAFTVLASAVNLTRLEMACPIFYRDDGKRVAREFYRYSYHWLEAVGRSKGSVDAAVDLVVLGKQNSAHTDCSCCTEEKRVERVTTIGNDFQSELRGLLGA